MATSSTRKRAATPKAMPASSPARRTPGRRAAQEAAPVPGGRAADAALAPPEAASPAPGTEPSSGTKADKPNLLRAGLKALGNVRDDVVQHQSRVFEAILGIEPAQAWSSLVKRDTGATKLAQEALGLRKFEAVFDQRVASALERLGMPPADALRAALDECAALRAEVAALKAELQRPPKPASRKR